MKNYATILMMAALLGSSTGFAQNAVNHLKTVTGTPCVTMGPTAHHHKKHHAANGIAAAPRHHSKAVAHHHRAVKPQPVMRTLETISVDDHLSTAIVSIKNGEVYINDSLVTTIKNPQCEDHRLIINYITPPPPPAPPVVTETIETIKTNTYTGEKAEGMLGVWGTSNCCEEGVVVDDVMPGGPACKAGLRPGDVITRINDQKISDGNELKTAIASLSAGDNVAVTVRDYDGTETKHVELAKKEMPNNCGCSHEMWSACR